MTPRPTNRSRVANLVAVLAAIALAVAACGQSTVDAGGDLGSESNDVSAGSDANDEPPADDQPEPFDEPVADDGLQVILTGAVSGQTLCPGNVQPCVTLAGDLTVDGEQPEADTAYRITGSLANGVLTVAAIEKLPGSLDWIADHCDNKEPRAEPSTSESDPIVDYQLSIPDAYAIRWISPRRVLHMGVVGDAEPHQQALDELGVGDTICVVGWFPRTDAELEQVQSNVTAFIKQQWPDVGNWSSGREHHLGAVQVSVHQADATMVAELTDEFDDTVILDASIIVVNGSVADFETAAAPAGSSSSAGDTTVAGLVARCGPVTFDSIPPDPNGFEPVDAETQALLDSTTTGELAVETSDFVPAYSWSVASRTEDRLVLFGQRIEGEVGYGGDFANFIFERRDGVWGAAGWGGCSMEIDAPGFGSATTMLDPEHEPDPDSTELHVLIRERNCANGSAPVDREVVPVVTETDTSIEIVTLVEPVAGGANCPGNPWHPITITLDQPLGDRSIFDAQQPPPVERTWPPTSDDLNR